MDTSRILIYTPDSALRQPSRLAREMLRDLSGARMLAWQLALRDIRAKYRQSLLGVLWAFILPLTNTMAWLFIQASGIVTLQPTAISYPAYVFTGTILWAILVDAVNAPLQQTTAAKPMLSKLNFPREALILSGLYKTLFNAAIRVGVLLLALLVMGRMPNASLLLFPLALLSLILAGTAIGLFFTPVGLLYADVGKGLALLMQLLMYLTPVVFPAPSHGWAAALFRFNPLTPLISTARDSITALPLEHLWGFAFMNVLMVVLLVVAWGIYRAAMPILIERMSA